MKIYVLTRELESAPVLILGAFETLESAKFAGESYWLTSKSSDIYVHEMQAGQLYTGDMGVRIHAYFSTYDWAARRQIDPKWKELP